MKRPFAANVWKENNWYVAQWMELDVVRRGETEEEALDNLREALDLYFEPPQATRPPKVQLIAVEFGSAQTRLDPRFLFSPPQCVPASNSEMGDFQYFGDQLHGSGK